MSEIIKLEGLEAIRLRSGMYVGDTQDGSALHHLFYEVFSNSLDEFLEKHCTTIWIKLLTLDTISITDNGRGISVNFNEKEQKYDVELALENVHAGGKFNKNLYAKSSGLNGVGIKAVNALSENLLVEIWRHNKHYSLEYSKGKQIKPLQEDDNLSDLFNSGTRLTFTPDKEIFKNIINFDSKILIQIIRQTAYLNKGLKIYFEDVDSSVQEFYYENGLCNFLQDLDSNTKLIEPIVFEDTYNDVDIKFGLVWSNSFQETFRCYTNNSYQVDGGTHLSCFRSSLTKILLPLCKEKDTKIEVISDDLREGLTYIVSIYIADPRFSSQTKSKLVNSEISSDLNYIIQKNLKNFFEKNQFLTQKIIDRILIIARAREAARRAKENVTKSGTSIAVTKLKECSETDERLRELFLVEGDSAGGTAKEARNRKFQAILPLRGKVLNVEKASAEKIQANKEINILRQVIGEPPNYNYHKVIILTDADHDGKHIATLLLTLFYRYMPDLIEQGYVYMGRPPLFRATLKKNYVYFKNEFELEQFQKHTKVKDISRFKGLGEMQPKELWDTTMNPLTRNLQKIVITDPIEAESCFEVLMGSEVDPRKEFIINSDKWKNLKIDI